jgi:hypothetical protein
MVSRRNRLAWNRPQSAAEWVLFAVFGGSFVTMIAEIAWRIFRF